MILKITIVVLDNLYNHPRSLCKTYIILRFMIYDIKEFFISANYISSRNKNKQYLSSSNISITIIMLICTYWWFLRDVFLVSDLLNLPTKNMYL
jgi:hypothetical protein